MRKQPTNEQIKQLNKMIADAFLELRMIDLKKNYMRAYELIDVFHNLPSGMFSETFDWQVLRDDYFMPYITKYPRHKNGPLDYVWVLDQIWQNDPDVLRKEED